MARPPPAAGRGQLRRLDFPRERSSVLRRSVLGYTVYRSFNAEAFRLAASHTEIIYGTINTGLLLTSSMTMTIALRAATVGLRRVTLLLLAVTLALGLAFLATKGLEYASDLDRHLFPGPEFPLSPPATQLFWAYYWVMTGFTPSICQAGSSWSRP